MGRRREDAMKRLKRTVHALMRNEEGQGLVEYALILVLVSIVAIGALELIGQNVTSVLNVVANHLNPVG
jgi:pilus assembly protein Flp/PilA